MLHVCRYVCVHIHGLNNQVIINLNLRGRIQVKGRFFILISGDRILENLPSPHI